MFQMEVGTTAAELSKWQDSNGSSYLWDNGIK
jgi:hypothetical protein